LLTQIKFGNDIEDSKSDGKGEENVRKEDSDEDEEEAELEEEEEEEDYGEEKAGKSKKCKEKDNDEVRTFRLYLSLTIPFGMIRSHLRFPKENSKYSFAPQPKAIKNF
jgi:hypothetical protein